MTLVRPAAQKPPISVMPTKTTAVTAMPVRKVKTSGSRDERIAPPATYCSEVMTTWMTSWPITPSTRAAHAVVALEEFGQGGDLEPPEAARGEQAHDDGADGPGRVVPAGGDADLV